MIELFYEYRGCGIIGIAKSFYSCEALETYLVIERHVAIKLFLVFLESSGKFSAEQSKGCEFGLDANVRIVSQLRFTC